MEIAYDRINHVLEMVQPILETLYTFSVGTHKTSPNLSNFTCKLGKAKQSMRKREQNTQLTFVGITFAFKPLNS